MKYYYQRLSCQPFANGANSSSLLIPVKTRHLHSYLVVAAAADGGGGVAAAPAAAAVAPAVVVAVAELPAFAPLGRRRLRQLRRHVVLVPPSACSIAPCQMVHYYRR